MRGDNFFTRLISDKESPFFLDCGLIENYSQLFQKFQE